MSFPRPHYGDIPTTRTTVLIPTDLLRRAQVKAAANDTSISAVIRTALRSYVWGAPTE